MRGGRKSGSVPPEAAPTMTGPEGLPRHERPFSTRFSSAPHEAASATRPGASSRRTTGASPSRCCRSFTSTPTASCGRPSRRRVRRHSYGCCWRGPWSRRPRPLYAGNRHQQALWDQLLGRGHRRRRGEPGVRDPVYAGPEPGQTYEGVEVADPFEAIGHLT